MPARLKPTLLSMAILTVISGTALAAPKADVNKDGQITQAEFMAAAADKFDATDTNFDGVLTKDEMKARRESRRAERRERKFDRMDTDGNGVISKAEMAAAEDMRTTKRQARRLARLDTNGDSVISDTEKAAAKAKRAERRGKGRMDRLKRVKRDADGDGLITRAEFDAATEAMFLRLDSNGDGVLTKGEGRKGKRKRRGGPDGR